jgi:hypothetical protein
MKLIDWTSSLTRVASSVLDCLYKIKAMPPAMMANTMINSIKENPRLVV